MNEKMFVREREKERAECPKMYIPAERKVFQSIVICLAH